MNILEEIQHIGLFAGVPREKMQALILQSTYKTLQPGEIIVSEQDPVRAFYVVISGQLKLYKSSAEGKEQTLYLLGPGEPFGLCTAFATDSFPASVMAIEKSAVLLIPGLIMEAVAMKEPALLLNIIQILSRRLKESMTLVESLSLKEIPQRIAAFFLQSVPENDRDKKSSFELAITQRELAKIIGATPEALSRSLKKMGNDKIVKIDGRKINILNREALQELAKEAYEQSPPKL
jgi:CRP/FNR family transcriptional regulator, dissimilatory nitrate respiration regulator